MWKRENKSNLRVENLTNTTSVSKGNINSEVMFTVCSLIWCNKIYTLSSSPNLQLQSPDEKNVRHISMKDILKYTYVAVFKTIKIIKHKESL